MHRDYFLVKIWSFPVPVASERSKRVTETSKTIDPMQVENLLHVLLRKRRVSLTFQGKNIKSCIAWQERPRHVGRSTCPRLKWDKWNTPISLFWTHNSYAKDGLCSAYTCTKLLAVLSSDSMVVLFYGVALLLVLASKHGSKRKNS